MIADAITVPGSQEADSESVSRLEFMTRIQSVMLDVPKTTANLENFQQAALLSAAAVLCAEIGLGVEAGYSIAVAGLYEMRRVARLESVR